ncbi:MAG: hypothetical protein U0470_07800 [Anaerolineae bacterium]
MLGINAAGDDLAALASAVASARAVGVHAIRVRLDRGRADAGRAGLAHPRRRARGARGGGVRRLAVIDASPAWARRDPPALRHGGRVPSGRARPASAAPTEPADLGRFVAVRGALPRRADRPEVWREPNVLPHWCGGGLDPEAYAALLVAAAGAARTAAPGVPVISAGLAPTTDVGVCAMSDYVYLDRLA